MKAKLREVDLVFHIPIGARTKDWRQVVVQVGLLHGRLDITFNLGGRDQGEALPASILEGLQEALSWAAKNVRAKDLVEMDPEERVEE